MPLSASVGSRILDVNATAEPGRGPLAFALVESPSAFGIDASTGEITLQEPLAVASTAWLTVTGAIAQLHRIPHCTDPSFSPSRFIHLPPSFLFQALPAHYSPIRHCSWMNVSQLHASAFTCSHTATDTRAECHVLDASTALVSSTTEGCVTTAQIEVKVRSFCPIKLLL